MRVELQGSWLVDTDTNTPIHLRQLRPLEHGEVVLVDEYGGGKPTIHLTAKEALKERLKAVIAQDREKHPTYAWRRSPLCTRRALENLYAARLAGWRRPPNDEDRRRASRHPDVRNVRPIYRWERVR